MATDDELKAEVLRSLVGFLRMACNCEGIYETPTEAAEGLLRRLAHDGLRVVRADRDQDDDREAIRS
jgi:hypothetical protein